MTETIFRVQLGELQTVRIICACGGAMEVRMELFSHMGQDPCLCPACGKDLRQEFPPNQNLLRNLGEAIERVLSRKDKFTIEFPIRVTA